MVYEDYWKTKLKQGSWKIKSKSSIKINHNKNDNDPQTDEFNSRNRIWQEWKNWTNHKWIIIKLKQKINKNKKKIWP